MQLATVDYPVFIKKRKTDKPQSWSIGNVHFRDNQVTYNVFKYQVSHA